ncbi:MAG: zinc ribbon domain-containing protein [Algibacter sp.]
MGVIRKTEKNVNVLQGKITCYECKSIMHQKVNPKERVNQYVCKNQKCGNSINREWLYKAVRLVVNQHYDKSELDKAIYDKTLELLKQDKLILIRKLSRKRKRENKLKHNKDKYIKSIGTRLYYLELRTLEADLSELEPKYNNTKDEIERLKVAFKLKTKRFSKDEENFKIQIDTLLYSVEIKSNEVDIKIFKWRVYTWNKPSSNYIFWYKKDDNKNHILKLPQRKYWSDNKNVTDVIYNYLNPTSEDEINAYFESEEYKLKIEEGKKPK